MTIKCPICKKPVDEDSATEAGSTFPFCSDRCRTIDLARWLDGAYQIPVQNDDDVFEDTDQLDQPDRTDR